MAIVTMFDGLPAAPVKLNCSGTWSPDNAPVGICTFTLVEADESGREARKLGAEIVGLRRGHVLDGAS